MIKKVITLLATLLLTSTSFSADWKDINIKAQAEFSSGNYKKAIELYNEVIKQNDSNPSPWINRGSCYSYLGKLEHAIKDFDKALKIAIKLTKNKNHPNLAYIYYNKAYALDNAGEIEKAISIYERVIKINPSYPDARGNLAWILATAKKKSIRNPNKAIQLAFDEMKLKGENDPDILDTLAAAYAAKGNFSKAISTINKAIKLSNTEEFKQRLSLYKKKKIYIIGAQGMESGKAQTVWNEYHQKILNRRLVEVEIINEKLKAEGITSENQLIIDFHFFSKDKQGAEDLRKQLSENYEMSVECKDKYWLIKGTTRPYVINLEYSQHVDWVKFMHDVALSHNALFSTWVLTEAKLKKTWSNENIETNFD
ncbi:MAG: tetratricopeptide repeat protein [Deltaproteobacteria bacterium]|nr:tetratricopeptide repeat protein [Deltaproteobacteria bacterium]